MSTFHVVNVSVEASIGQEPIPVTGATLSLGVNAIPTLELQCIPTRSGTSKSLKPNIIRPSIGEYNERYSDLSSKAAGLDTSCNATIQLTDSISGRSETVQLDGWILSGVGLSSVSATSAPYLSVIIQHPICRLTKIGSVYETPKSDLRTYVDGLTAKGTDFLDIIGKVYEGIKGDGKFWPVHGGDTDPSIFREALGVSPYDPKEYLVFKKAAAEQGIFLGKGSDMSERLAQAEGRIVFPSSGGTSIWDMLIGSCGQTLLSVTQDQDDNFTGDHLVLEPTKPWKNYSVTLKEEDCFWTDIPGFDQMRLIGVMARKLGPYTDAVSLGLLRNGNPRDEDSVADVLYCPVKSAADSGGRILKTEAPSILDSAFRRDAPFGLPITEGMIEADKERKDGYDAAIGKYCKAVYEMTAGSMMNGRAQMALWMRESGDNHLILPGNTCRFISEEKVIYYGYIQQVIHQMSTEGNCSTTLQLSHVRPTEDFKIGSSTVIAADSPNAAYA